MKKTSVRLGVITRRFSNMNERTCGVARMEYSGCSHEKGGGPPAANIYWNMCFESLGFRFFSPQQLSRQSIGVYRPSSRSGACASRLLLAAFPSISLPLDQGPKVDYLGKRKRNIQRQLNVCTRLSNSPSLLLSLLLLVRAFRTR